MLPFNLRKQLVSSLVLSRIDYANIITNDVPQYLLRRLQKVQNAAAGFVYGRHASVADVISLSWLPVNERFEYAIAVQTFKSIHQSSPENTRVKMREVRRNLRNNIERDGPLIDCVDKAKTFQADAKRVFKALPKKIRESKELFSFKRELKQYLLDKALANIL